MSVFLFIIFFRYLALFYQELDAEDIDIDKYNAQESCFANLTNVEPWWNEDDLNSISPDLMLPESRDFYIEDIILSSSLNLQQNEKVWVQPSFPMSSELKLSTCFESQDTGFYTSEMQINHSGESELIEVDVVNHQMSGSMTYENQINSNEEISLDSQRSSFSPGSPGDSGVESFTESEKVNRSIGNSYSQKLKKSNRGRPRKSPEFHLKKLEMLRTSINKDQAKKIRNLAACLKYRHKVADQINLEENSLKRIQKKLLRKLKRLEDQNNSLKKCIEDL